MPNMSLKKIPMPEQAPNIRNKNFDEVAEGYTVDMAAEEAMRCLKCKNKPCVSGCPVNVQIPEFINSAADGDYLKAYEIITADNSLPAVCGRVCPQERQCEERCVRGIKGEPVAIGRLERFCADFYMEKHNSEKLTAETVSGTDNGIKVAVIGAGPAGLTCAGDLCRLGYTVTVFEAFHTAGGVLVYGIPEFRLPKDIVKKEIDGLISRGVEIKTNMVIGKTLSLEELFKMGYKACFIGSGAGLPVFMGIEGEELIGVLSANEYLTRINLMKAYKPDSDTPLMKSENIIVVGGGNVAMDAARCAKRLGAKNVYIVYRRSITEMPARAEEIHHAEEEGIIFKCLANPVGIIGDEKGRVKAVTCIKMELGEPDQSGRRKPKAVPDSEFEIKADTVIMAIGTSPNPLIRTSAPNLETDKRGCLKADGELKTTMEAVWAGGDAVTGAATVILAMGAGKKAAASIDEYLKKSENAWCCTVEN